MRYPPIMYHYRPIYNKMKGGSYIKTKEMPARVRISAASDVFAGKPQQSNIDKEGFSQEQCGNCLQAAR